MLSWMAILDILIHPFICDQDSAFMSNLAQYFFQQFGIKIITVTVTNHK